MTAKLYNPPYTTTMLNLVAEISEKLGRLSAFENYPRDLRLRRANRIRTIQGSLAIEGNTLSEAQITAILDGKHLVAPLREIQEVKNAIAVYDRLQNWDSEKDKDLLQVHGILIDRFDG